MAEKKMDTFLREGEHIWRCGICGKTVVGYKPPEPCPVCGKINSFFRIEPEKY